MRGWPFLSVGTCYPNEAIPIQGSAPDETGAYTVDLKSALWSQIENLLGENGLRGYKHKTFSLPCQGKRRLIRG